jgi:hypothetical protein
VAELARLETVVEQGKHPFPYVVVVLLRGGEDDNVEEVDASYNQDVAGPVA